MDLWRTGWNTGAPPVPQAATDYGDQDGRAPFWMEPPRNVVDSFVTVFHVWINDLHTTWNDTIASRPLYIPADLKERLLSWVIRFWRENTVRNALPT
jgi:hypothetical protein